LNYWFSTLELCVFHTCSFWQNCRH
jgi:hypothetical protein